MVAGLQPGGQLTITTDVENYPGFADPIQGPWLMEQMRAQAANVGTRIFDDVIVSVDLSKRPFVCTGDSGNTYIGDTLVIATGASAKWLGLDSERKYSGMGVSACATCDGFFYRNKEVAVIGGGNTAVEEAIYMTNHANKVTLVHRRDSLRAERIMQERLFANPKVEVRWNSVVDEILGGGMPAGVTGVRLRDVQTGALSDLAVDGVFIAIGHKPNTDLLTGQLDMDETGYLITAPDSTATSVPGVFAAGDV
jgi:thioredoxin reductase (NADPH)